MRKLISSIALVLFCGSVMSQDLHFSQFYFSHFSVNPAFTGKIKEDFRVFGIHRTQWGMIGSRFMTTGFAYDMNFKGNQSNKNIFGAGIAVVNDDIIEGVMKEQSILLSGAWHRSIDHANRHIISAGFSAGLAQKTISGPQAFLFGNEFNEFGRPPDTDADLSGETFGGSYMNFKANIGGAWTFVVNEKLDLTTGLSMFNVNRPRQTFYSETSLSDTTRLNTTKYLTVFLNYKITDFFSLHPNILVMGQSGARNIIAGTFFGFQSAGMRETNSIFMVGPYYRMSDALILATAFRFRNYRLGVSYDITASGLRDTKNIPDFERANIGALEISFTYLGLLNRAVPGDFTIPCKFF